MDREYDLFERMPDGSLKWRALRTDWKGSSEIRRTRHGDRERVVRYLDSKACARLCRQHRDRTRSVQTAWLSKGKMRLMAGTKSLPVADFSMKLPSPNKRARCAASSGV